MSIQPVSMLMSNLNVESTARMSPNALAAAQETGQSQEIIREGIRAVQTVQASEAAFEAQRVHRKSSGEDGGEGRRGGQDSFTRSRREGEEETAARAEDVPLIRKTVIRETVRSRKSVEFLA